MFQASNISTGLSGSDFCNYVSEIIDTMCDAMKCLPHSLPNEALRTGLKKIKSDVERIRGKSNAAGIGTLLNSFKQLVNEHKDASILIHIILYFGDILKTEKTETTTETTTEHPIRREIIASCDNNHKLKQSLNNVLELIENTKLPSEEQINHDKFKRRAKRYILERLNNKVLGNPSAYIPVRIVGRTSSSSSSDSGSSIIDELKKEGYVLSKDPQESLSESLRMDFKRRFNGFCICGKGIIEWAEDYNSHHNQDDKISVDDLLNDESKSEQERVLQYAIKQMLLGYLMNKNEENWQYYPDMKKPCIESLEQASDQCATIFYKNLKSIYSQSIFGIARSFLVSAGTGNYTVQELENGRYWILFMEHGGKVCADSFYLIDKFEVAEEVDSKTECVSKGKELKFREPGLMYSHVYYDAEGKVFVLEELKAACVDPKFDRLLRAVINKNINEAFEPPDSRDFNNAEIISLKHFIGVVAYVKARIQMACANLPHESRPKKLEIPFFDKLSELQISAQNRLRELNVHDEVPTQSEAEQIKTLFCDRLPCKATKDEKDEKNYRRCQVETRKRSASIFDWLGFSSTSSKPPLPPNLITRQRSESVLDGKTRVAVLKKENRSRSSSTPQSPEGPLQLSHRFSSRF
ncbi:MAG: hypothetical protein AMJ43_04560 [Coxiella sp. DG_40]|nr:MAG: hypothetical protein AMJ43_04560 [Coxiella sp. DG_40]